MIDLLLARWRDMALADWAENKYGWITEDGQPITLAPWQRVVLSAYWSRRHTVSTLFISTTKKAGKTLLNSLITCYRWLTVESPRLHFTVGNDQDQSAELQITMIGDMVKRHPVLSKLTKVTRNELTFEPTGARIVALPMHYQGSGGGNFSTVSLTELWAFLYEGGRRLYEELTPIPHVDCLRIVDSYAGYEQESELLQDVWNRGMAGDLINADWPIYLTGQQLSYIHQGEDAQERCWRGDPAQREPYYQEQRGTLRESTYRRLHLNEWAASESIFITPEQWDALVMPGYRCPGSGVRLFVGLDASTKHDKAAAVSVYSRNGTVYLGPYRIFQPPTDFDAIESYILGLGKRYGLSAVTYDPYQLEYLAQRLKSAGIRTVEFPQSIPRLTEAGNCLFDLVKQGGLAVYAGADDLRGHALSAAARETPRGIRLVKSETGKKIDAAIALAMACTIATSDMTARAVDSALLERAVNPDRENPIEDGDLADWFTEDNLWQRYWLHAHLSDDGAALAMCHIAGEKRAHMADLGDYEAAFEHRPIVVFDLVHQMSGNAGDVRALIARLVKERGFVGLAGAAMDWDEMGHYKPESVIAGPSFSGIVPGDMLAQLHQAGIYSQVVAEDEAAYIVLREMLQDHRLELPKFPYGNLLACVAIAAARAAKEFHAQAGGWV